MIAAVLCKAMVSQPVAIFLIVLSIILFAPILLNKLKIPHIIGLIVAGVLIGPYGFNVLDNDSSFAIFGQVGLLYLMFLAGLEIDMYHLRLNLRRGMLFGVLTLMVPLLLGMATSMWVLHLDWVTSMLLGAMYASHTLLSYPVAARFGITKSPAVLISIVGTIIAVTGALLVLAATVNIKRSGAFEISSMLRLLGFAALYCAAVLYIYPRLTRWFFRQYADRVTQFVYVLAMVFLAAFGAQAAGLEGVLGAFFAGLVLNRYVPSGSSLMSSIEFVGNALFIPYFLISVGMLINVRVAFNPASLSIAAVMLTVAIVSKYIPAWIAQRAAGLSASSRGVMFGLTAAHTAVALAVVTLGYDLNMLDERMLNATILVILVTCALAPMVTSAYAPKLKVEEMDHDDETEQKLLRRTRHNNTLIPLGSTMLVPSLMELALLMRNERGSHQITALHVRTDNTKSARSSSKGTLEEARSTAASADETIETIERFDINIVTGVLNAISERDITEVILGMHRRTTVIDSFFGNKVDQLLRSTNKMLIISRTFVPLSTTARIVVWAPPHAQYETGFARWVRAMARLTKQIGCRIIFCCAEDCQPLIRGVIYQGNYGIRCEFRTVEQWDDFILMSNRILDDDLFVVIGARVNSLSYIPAMVEMPDFLQKYFPANNLLVIYPEQFGESTALESFADPMAADIASAPSPLMIKLTGLWRRLIDFKRRITHRNRRKRIDI